MDPIQISVFGVPGVGVLWFLTFVAFGVFGWRVWQLIGLLRRGRYENRFDQPVRRAWHAIRHVLLQPRIFGERSIGLPHFLIFWVTARVRINSRRTTATVASRNRFLASSGSLRMGWRW